MRRTTGHPEVDALRRFDQLAGLNPQRLAELATRVEIREVSAGTSLVELGSREPTTVFLLDGRVRLEAHDGQVRTITHHDPAARSPLCRLRPTRWRALAASAVRYLQIADALLEEYLENRASFPGTQGYAVSELEEGDPCEDPDCHNDLVLHLYEDLTRNRLRLPSLPLVASNIGRRTAALGQDTGSIAKLLMLDPALAMKVLRVARAEARNGREVRNCHEAVSRLGSDAVHTLVAQCALLETFRPEAAGLGTRMEAWWERSLLASAIGRAMAELTEVFDPDFAALVTLSLDIGEAAILDYADQVRHAALDAGVRAHTGNVGRLLLSGWGLPPELPAAAAQTGNWRRDTGQPVADYTDLALVAHACARTAGGDTDNPPPVRELPAASRLGIGDFSDVFVRELIERGRHSLAQAKNTVLPA